jgi:hypothetical protein
VSFSEKNRLDGIEPRSAALIDQRLTTFIGFAT